MILSSVGRFLSEVGSNKLWITPEYCLRWKEPGGRPARLKNLFSSGYNCQGELET
jgi:hypothetical protein